jgi:hypothetical protein
MMIGLLGVLTLLIAAHNFRLLGAMLAMLAVQP